MCSSEPEIWTPGPGRPFIFIFPFFIFSYFLIPEAPPAGLRPARRARAGHLFLSEGGRHESSLPFLTSADCGVGLGLGQGPTFSDSDHNSGIGVGLGLGPGLTFC